MSLIRRILFALGAAALALTVIGCGDGDGDGGAEEAADGDVAGAADGEGDASSDEASADGATDGASVGASVTIGGQTYTALEELVCVRLGGALSAQFADRDAGITIDVDLPPEDWETDTGEDWDPPSVRVDVGDEAQLQAGNSDIVVGMPETAVTAYTIDGTHASGQGDFVDVFQAPDAAQVVAGSFDVTCEER